MIRCQKGVKTWAPLFISVLSIFVSSAQPKIPATDREINRPASQADLLRRWQAPEPANQDALIEFAEHGVLVRFK
jgi:hypothetical protein